VKTFPQVESDIVVVVEAIEASRLLLSSWFSARGIRVFTFADPTTALLMSHELHANVVLLGPSLAGADQVLMVTAIIQAFRWAEPHVEFVVLRRRDQFTNVCAHSDVVAFLDEPWSEAGLMSAVASGAGRKRH